MAGKLKYILILPFLIIIRCYRLMISPLLPPSCRFTPTCSAYAEEALKKHGILKGTLLSVWRIVRCQPFCKGGYDPVPDKKDQKNNKI